MVPTSPFIRVTGQQQFPLVETLKGSHSCEIKMDVEDFSYDSVPVLANEVRLFTISTSPSSGSADTVEVNLTTTSISNLPEFKSLSYHWGHPKSEAHSPCTILVNGKSLDITQSLYIALCGLRESHENLPLWADQVCINQIDPKEKGEQLRHMATIYGHSTSTIAWLGGENASSAAAMDRLGELGREAHELGITGITAEQYRHLHDSLNNNGGNMLGVRVREWIGNQGDMLDMIGFDAMCNLFKLTYFIRGWIREEIALPTSLVFRWGSSHVDGDRFCDAVNLLILYYHHHTGMLRFSATPQAHDMVGTLDEKIASLSGIIHQSAAVRRQYQLDSSVRRFNMAHILRKCCYLDFEKAKDRVYGVMGMANDREELNIPVRYEASASWQDVYTETTMKIIQKVVESDEPWSGINFLLLCGSNPPRIADSDPADNKGLPSWVPDLAQQNEFTLADITTLASAHPFNASRGLSHPVTEEDQKSVHSSVLLCRVVVVDRIVARGSPGHAPVKSKAELEAEKEKLSSMSSQEKKRYEEEALEEQGRLAKTHLKRALQSIATFAQKSAEVVISDASTPTSSSKHPYRNKGRKTLLDAQWRVPILDHEYVSSPTALRRATLYSKEGYMALLGMKVPGGKGVIANGTEKAEHYEVQLDALGKRAPFLGEKGFVGVGPTAAREGDLVCVIQGGAFPFVLREKLSSSHSAAASPSLSFTVGQEPVYELVGEAYCDGIMDGEAFDVGLPSRTVKLV